MKVIKYPDRKDWENLLKRPAIQFDKLEEVVSMVLEAVKSGGDKQLKAFTKKFDGVELSNITIDRKQIEEAEVLLSPELKKAIQQARENIERFHISQKEEIKQINTAPGVVCWRKSIGIEKVGLYIPGGSAPLFSTLLMLGVPAKIAECKEIILCTPPNKEGKVDPAILYTAKLIGIDKIYLAGGAQAIAAMAYGTETIPKVYKIFGPGNQYVTMAKMLINSNGTAIDMPAGPSEVLIIADNTAEPSFVAADLLSQAEHGPDSQVILVSDKEEIIEQVNNALDEQLKALPRKEIATKALENSKAFLVSDLKEAMDISNTYAPEHLILSIKDVDKWADRVINAGSVFLGNYSPESAGDYASGTNHTLPTNGYATAYSGVSLDSFYKKVTFQKLSEAGIKNIGKTIEEMASAEQLQAHKNAVSIRLKSLN